jgi:hypothetical protein
MRIPDLDDDTTLHASVEVSERRARLRRRYGACWSRWRNHDEGSAMEKPFALIGRRSGVYVFQRAYVPTVELAAVGEIDAGPAEVHDALLMRVDPRIIAHIAERWIGSKHIANDRDFSFSARWTTGVTPGLKFHIVDNRGTDTRARNWVNQVIGSWKLEPVDDGRFTRASYQVRIEFASEVARWTIRTGALQDLPSVIEQLRSLVTHDQLPAAATNTR